MPVVGLAEFNLETAPLPARFHFVGPKFQSAYAYEDENGGEQLMEDNWTFGWAGWVNGRQYGDYILLTENAEGPILDKLKEILTIQAKRTVWKLTA